MEFFMARLTLFVLIFLTACSKPIPPLNPAPAPKPAADDWGKNESVVTFAAVGDLLMHQAVKDTAAHAATQGVGNQGYDFLWSDLQDELSQVDLAFANLETPIAPTSSIGTGAFLFNADPVVLKSLQTLGIDLVSFANNHAYDQGRKGFIETIDELRKTQLEFIGAGDTCEASRTALIKDIKGIKIGFIGASAIFNNQLNDKDTDACVNVFERESAIESVKKAREAGAEFVVYSIHWGVEYKTQPAQLQIDDAHALMDAGVDVLLGHHPHVLQPVEVYETADKRIATAIYSLGNFVSNQSRFYRHGISPDHVGDPRDGVIFRFSAIRKNYGVGKSRVELAQVSAQPTWTENNWLARQRGTEKETLIRVVTNDQRIQELQSELEKATEEDKIIELKKSLELYQQRHKSASLVLGEEWIYQVK
jgi:Bacterial capsule synthesis protein PGA_cap